MNDLACAITGSGGFIFWAEKLGMSRVESDSDFGWAGEKRVMELLEGKGFTVSRSVQVKAPYDLLVGDLVKIDVKTAQYAAYGTSKGWFYRIGKTPSSDIICLLQADTSDVYIIPWHVCPRTNITITPTGKTYAQYLNAYDTLSKLVEMRSKERELWAPVAPFHTSKTKS